MIKFFRHIRKSLISENKMGKYFKYAIGEILLVVIGILIALQVNNWNEQRKLKDVETNLLEELLKDLEFTENELELVAKYNANDVARYKKIRTYFNEDLPYNEELDSAFGRLDVWNMPYIPFIAYQNLKEKGLDLIKNDSLKRQIIEVYEFNIKMLTEDYGEWEWSFNQNTTQRLMVKHIRRNDEGNLAKPNSYEALKGDDEFRNFLNILIPVRADHADILSETTKPIALLIEHITTELAKRD
jgi:hypothetical protein